jgi:streptomycin 3"-adenylyltransferase
LRPSSDVDVMVVVNDGLTDDKRKMLVSALMKVSGRVGDAAIRPLELTIVQLSEVVPWRYPPRMEFCYGEWLREAFEKGQIPSPSPNPDLAIILTQVRNEGVTLLGSDASALFDPVPMADLHRAMRECLPHLLEWLWGDERNVLLTLARMWLTASVGEIAPKDAAAEWAIERLPKEQALLLDVARRAYLGECLDDWKGQESRVMALATSMETSIKACLIE